MRAVRGGGWNRTFRACVAAALLVLYPGVARSVAQSCTTQARMTAQQRTELGSAAYSLAAAVAAGDAAKVRLGTVRQYAGDPNQTAYLVRSTADRISGDQLAVTQLYLLDATARGRADNGPAEFACALNGTASETDFVINGLPFGHFAFAMVEAQGPHPWLLPFLLEQEDGAWKMAGFYPHARTAGGHDGLWYWTAARADVKASKPWLGWMMYGMAAQLLRPAAFVSTGNLDKLLAEQRAAAPEGLAAGVSTETPLAIRGTDGTVYQVTSLGADIAVGDASLNLTMHIEVKGSSLAADAATERNLAAARALLQAHPELRDGFSEVTVVADGANTPSFVVQRPLGALASLGGK